MFLFSLSLSSLLPFSILSSPSPPSILFLYIYSIYILTTWGGIPLLSTVTLKTRFWGHSPRQWLAQCRAKNTCLLHSHAKCWEHPTLGNTFKARSTWLASMPKARNTWRYLRLRARSTWLTSISKARSTWLPTMPEVRPLQCQASLVRLGGKLLNACWLPGQKGEQHSPFRPYNQNTPCTCPSKSN